MCPLRVILIFLSATLAGFFVLRRLNSQPEEHQESEDRKELQQQQQQQQQLPFSTKVGSAICSGFWTCVDMASGRYLWRNLVAAPAPAGAKKC